MTKNDETMLIEMTSDTSETESDSVVIRSHVQVDGNATRHEEKTTQGLEKMRYERIARVPSYHMKWAQVLEELSWKTRAVSLYIK